VPGAVFCGLHKEEYDVEVNRLVSFLETSGGSLRGGFEAEREKASEELDFERAAAIHKKVEKLDDVLRGRPELARRIQDLDAVILQRTAREQTIGVYAVRGGRLAEPYELRFGDTSEPRSAEETVREYLEGVMGGGVPLLAAASPVAGNIRQSAAELGEHLCLVARWYYSNPREGEIFYRERTGRTGGFCGLAPGCWRRKKMPRKKPGFQKKSAKRGAEMSRGATQEGTKKYAAKLQGAAAEGHFREVQGLTISSLGAGTYLGQPTKTWTRDMRRRLWRRWRMASTSSIRQSTTGFSEASGALAQR